MDNPLTFLLVIVGVFFGLWLVGGGPSRAISFSGPYITPISDVGDSQDGYGPKLATSTTVSIPGGASVTVGSKSGGGTAVSPSSAQTPSTKTTTTGSAYKTSSFNGKAVITKTSVASAQNPSDTYVELLLTSHSSTSLTASNWKLVSKTTGGTVLIKNGSSSNVTLAPNQSALIVTSFPSKNSHDTVTLLDGDSAAISSVTY